LGLQSYRASSFLRVTIWVTVADQPITRWGLGSRDATDDPSRPRRSVFTRPVVLLAECLLQIRRLHRLDAGALECPSRTRPAT
jgi:hypothetical protein